MISEHWENIYKNKSDREVSWTQSYPHTAISILSGLDLPKTSALIDIGGGASNFVDAALELGFSDVTVLDISQAALDRTSDRLGKKADLINWVVSDIREFETDKKFDFWYDRAVFHFLTAPQDIETYIDCVGQSVTKGGYFLLGTFSENGPKKCSGLEVTQYSDDKMRQTFARDFIAEKSFKETHITPFETNQEFQFCNFQRVV